MQTTRHEILYEATRLTRNKHVDDQGGMKKFCVKHLAERRIVRISSCFHTKWLCHRYGMNTAENSKDRLLSIRTGWVYRVITRWYLASVGSTAVCACKLDLPMYWSTIRCSHPTCELTYPKIQNKKHSDEAWHMFIFSLWTIMFDVQLSFFSIFWSSKQRDTTNILMTFYGGIRVCLMFALDFGLVAFVTRLRKRRSVYGLQRQSKDLPSRQAAQTGHYHLWLFVSSKTYLRSVLRRGPSAGPKA